MSDSNTAESVVTLSSKAEYENSINLSQHVPQAKTISEMVLDAFQSTRKATRSASCAPRFARHMTASTTIKPMS